MAASDALALACVRITFVTSVTLHSGHRFSVGPNSHLVQLPDSSRKHAISPRCVEEIGTSTSETEKAMHVAKTVVSRTRMQHIIMMNAQIKMSLFRFCRVDMTGLALMHQPIIAAMKKRAAVTRKRGPIQVASLWVRVFKTEELEKENISPNVTQLIIGRLIHAGTLDSRDFWTSGFDMMCSRAFTVSTSYRVEKSMRWHHTNENKSQATNLPNKSRPIRSKRSSSRRLGPTFPSPSNHPKRNHR